MRTEARWKFYYSKQNLFEIVTYFSCFNLFKTSKIEISDFFMFKLELTALKNGFEFIKKNDNTDIFGNY